MFFFFKQRNISCGVKRLMPLESSAVYISAHYETGTAAVLSPSKQGCENLREQPMLSDLPPQELSDLCSNTTCYMILTRCPCDLIFVPGFRTQRMTCLSDALVSVAWR